MPPKSTPKRKSREEWVRDAESGVLRHPSNGIHEKGGILLIPGSEFQGLDYSSVKRLKLPSSGTPFLLLSPGLMKALHWKFGCRARLLQLNIVIRVWPSDGSFIAGLPRDLLTTENDYSFKLFEEPLSLARRLYFKDYPQRNEAFISALKFSLEAMEVLSPGTEHCFTHYGKKIRLPLLAINDYHLDLKDESFSLANDFKSLQLASTPKKTSSSTSYYSYAWNETELIFLSDKPSASRSRPRLQDALGGLSGVLETLRKAILANSDKMKGILLFGPPGTGKTQIGHLIGDSLDYKTVSIVASDIFSKFYGETESKLKELFKRSSSHEGKEGTLLFIDDFDSLCPKRSDQGKSDQEKRVLSGLIHMLDMYRDHKGLVILGATSRLDAIDPILRRPGRFDYEIEIGVPTPIEREDIFRCLFKQRDLNVRDEDVVAISKKTHGYVGADLESLVSESLTLLEEEEEDKDLKSRKELRLPHLMSSLKKIRPSAMREVAIQVPDVTWEDIGGLDDLKLKLKQAVEWPLKRPEVFTRLGIKPPKGILMYGPPGCSKTMIAKALANESGLNFMAVKGPELFSKWVGESERAVRELFRKARSVAPSIIFFDEIDSLCSSRGGSSDSKVSDRVLAQLLTEMDGVEVLNSVTVVAATNRPDMIDKALMRPGRLDRVIYVSLPDEATRLKIFNIHSKRIPTEAQIDWKALSGATDGYSGAEISAVCNEAALRALERDINSTEVSEEDFRSALRIITPRINSELLNIYSDFQAVHQRSNL